MEDHYADALSTFNQLYKKMDELYHLYAKKLGIPDMTLWLLYALYETEGIATQRDFCAVWHYPPQTVNSALKGLVKQGIAALNPICGNQKNKQIVLTQRGKDYIEKNIFPLVCAERNAFQRMETEKRDGLLLLTQQYISNLQHELDTLL